MPTTTTTRRASGYAWTTERRQLANILKQLKAIDASTAKARSQTKKAIAGLNKAQRAIKR